MTQFYRVRHNTAYNRGMPEIGKIIAGLIDRGGPCPTCGSGRRRPSGDLRVEVHTARAKIWPDVIACGDYPCFVVSQRFVDAMKRCGVRLILGGKVELIGANEGGLPLDDAPLYFWIDGVRHRAAKMDFEASGYVDARFCSECGTFVADISLTHRRQHADPPSTDVFAYDEASGLDLFTTDLAPTAFFCTERVFECARQNKLTNLSFKRVEEGDLGKPLKYM